RRGAPQHTGHARSNCTEPLFAQGAEGRVALKVVGIGQRRHTHIENQTDGKVRNEHNSARAKNRRTRVLLPSGIVPFDVGRFLTRRASASLRAQRATAGRYGEAAGAPVATGIANWKTLPRPGSLVAQMRPP